MKNILFIIVSTIVLLYGSIHAQDVPRIISYQGVLVDANGTPKTQKGVNFGFTFYAGMNSSTIVVPIQNKTLDVVGGLFNTMLEIPVSAELNQELWLEIEANGTRYPNRIRMAAALYALNIADNVVTSRKIKDGEVNLQDLAPGNTPGEILKWNGTEWLRGQDEGLRSVTVEQPIEGDGTSTDPLRVTIPSGVPIGTVLPYMGDGNDLQSLESEGWYLCDGRLIANLAGLTVAQKTALQQLQSRAGNPNSGNLPDLRGMFLRGADKGAGKDPNAGERSGTGEKIGSSQGDEFKRHQHRLVNKKDNYSGAGEYGEGVQVSVNSGSPFVAIGTGWDGINFEEPIRASFEGGSETRPQNVYVNYIIKAR